MHDHEISSSDGPKRQSCRRRFRSWSDRSSIICGRLGAAIPLPKRVSPPVTEVGLSGLTKLLVSRENELGLSGSPRGGPSEGRAGNQRDQCKSSDKCPSRLPSRRDQSRRCSDFLRRDCPLSG